jgi:hypothetical protein
MTQILLQKFANREIRIGCQSIAIAKKKMGDRRKDLVESQFAQKILDLEVSAANLRDGWELGTDRKGCAIAIPYTLEKHDRCKSRLDIISEFQHRSLKVKNKGGWGFSPKPTTFGKNARHRLLEAGAIMDGLYGKNVCEVTCTIPGSTRESFRTVSQYSGWIMNRLTQIVRRSKHDPAWFYVWELQKRGALHLHFAIGCSNLPDALELAQKIEFKWFELLLELQDKMNVDVFRKNAKWSWRNAPEKWQSHVLPVYKSCAAYFSKYVGKQSNVVTRNNKAFCPARWWGSSSSIKRGVNDARVKISIEVSLPNVEEAIAFLRDVFSSFKPIKSYRYEFDLGKSKSGQELGGGWREISYYDDESFMSASSLMSALAEYVTQRWGIYAGIPITVTQTSKNKSIIGTQT